MATRTGSYTVAAATKFNSSFELQDCTTNDETDFPLHEAAKTGDILQVSTLLEQRHSVLQNNDLGEIPLHLACKHGHLEVVKCLLNHSGSSERSKQILTKNKIFGNTPLHVAALEGKEEVVNEMLQQLKRKCKKPIKGISVDELTNKLGDQPVHAAASKGHVKVMESFYYEDKDCIKRKGRFRGTPLHHACGYGRYDMVKRLVELKVDLETRSMPVVLPAFIRTTEQLEEVEDANVANAIEEQREYYKKEEEDDQFTPLTRACQFGHKEIVEYLLEPGQKVKIHPLALVKAIEGYYQDCAKVLIERTEDLTELMNYGYVPDGKRRLTTTFRELIQHMPDLAEIVLHKCVKLDRYLVNSSNFKIEFDFRIVDDYHGRPKNSGAISQREEHDGPTGDRSHKDRTEDIRAHGFDKSDHPLTHMVKHKCEKLLKHPVVAGLLHEKLWSACGVLSILQWVFYFIYLISFISLMFVLPHPQTKFCCFEDNTSESVESNLSTCRNSSDIICGADTDFKESMSRRPILPAIIVILYSIVRLPFEGLQLIFSVKKAFSQGDWKGDCLWHFFRAIRKIDYIWTWNNWVELPLFIISTIFAVTVFPTLIKRCSCPYNWQWEIGVITMMLAGFEFIALSTQFKIIGVYFLMFIRVLKTFIKFVLLGFLLVGTFALSFHFLLYKPDLMGSPFHNLGHSMLAVLSMTVGDVSARRFFGLDLNGQTSDTTHLQPYYNLATVVWLVSLIFMTILLSNLLIGLAVGDISTIHKKATLEKLALQVDTVLTLESQVRVLKICKRSDSENRKIMKSFEPNKKSLWETFKVEAVHAIWGGVRYDSRKSIQSLVEAKS